MKPIDDIQLTAYALGELSAEERKQIEEQLKHNPAQQAEVNEIRALAGQLAAELRQEKAPALTDEQRQAILTASAAPAVRHEHRAWPRWGGFAAVAAAVMLLFGGLFWNATRSMNVDDVARLEKQPEPEELRIASELVETPPPADLSSAQPDPQSLLVRMAAETAAGVTQPFEPEVEDFAATPASDEVLELEIASEIGDPVILSTLSPAAEGADKMEVAAARVNREARQENHAVRSLANGQVVQNEPRAKPVPSDAISPIILKNLAPGALACQAGAGQAARIATFGGTWTAVPVADCPPPPIYANTESYAQVDDNVFKQVANEPLSTFSIDVDTASYANIRRFLKNGQMPPPDAVRVEEMVNYFSYDYPQPKDEVPFAVHVESTACPWNSRHQLVKIGLKGKEIDAEARPPCNLVFLLDVSGSMNHPNKLPLVKKAMTLLAKQLTPQDRVSIAVYAGAAGLILPSTTCDNLGAIESALENLQAGGSTAGGTGIRLAYDEALKNLQTNGNNRVILCTDGDFNVGITDSDELSAFIAGRAKKGIFLTVLGFGMGNYKDDRLETLADQGNGNYAYIDSFSEARKNLAEQAAGTLFTIAKDVKLQIEFNPAHFDAYRLIGYENRVLAKEDFNNDKKDAGELGAGHTVTAFYELVPTGVEVVPGVDPLKYQPVEKPEEPEPETRSEARPEWLTVKLRYKLPDEDTSTKIAIPYTGSLAAFDEASEDFRFAAGVAAGGLLLREDVRIGDLTFQEVIAWVSATTGKDPSGYRREYLDLLKNAAVLAP